jgi:hypothetical protein
MDLPAQFALIPGWEIPKDSVIDSIVLGTHVDRLGDFDGCIALNPDVAPEVKDPFVGLRRRWEGG